MGSKFCTPLAAVLCAQLLTSAHAQEAPAPWLARIGYAKATFDTSATLKLGGTEVPGAALSIPAKSFVLGELGYEYSDRWTARLAIAPPPTVNVVADGSLKAYTPPLSGHLGKVKIAPLVLTATYKLGDFNGLMPYVGAGINYTSVLSTTDGDIASIRGKNAWGSALQLGVDWAVDRHWSIFFDARKVYVKTTGTGTVTALGSAPAWGRVALDPLIVSSGVGYRF